MNADYSRLPVYPYIVTLRCEATCGWCRDCRGPDGPDMQPNAPGERPFPDHPAVIRLVGGDPFVFGDLQAWSDAVRARADMALEVEGPAYSLASSSARARLFGVEPDGIRVRIATVDDAIGREWLGVDDAGSGGLAAIEALAESAFDVTVVVPVNERTVERLIETVEGIGGACEWRLPVVLTRAPLADSDDQELAEWGELPALADALQRLNDVLPQGARVSIDRHEGWGACVLSVSDWREGLLPIARSRRSLESTPAPDICGDCALQPHCAWRLNTAAPRAAMIPLDEEQAGVVLSASSERELTQVTGTRTERDYDRIGVKELLCYAPWTTLSVNDQRKRPVPCAYSWVEGYMRPREEARWMGISEDEMRALNARAEELYECGHFRAQNEDITLLELWNAPTLMHMRKQMRSGGSSRRCRPSCRVILGVEERGIQFLTRPDSDLTPEAVANRRVIVDEINGGAYRLESRPLGVTLGVSSRCNVSCGFCSGPLGKYGELTDRRTQDVIGLLPTLMHLNVVGPGEPLMSRGFGNLLAHIADNDYPSLFVSLTTNGTLLSPKWIERHERVPWGSLRISLNSGSAATHERVIGKRMFDRMMENVEAIVAYRDRAEHACSLTLSCVISKTTMGDLGGFAEIVDRFGTNIALEPQSGNDNNLSPYTDAELTRRVLDECEEQAARFATRNPSIARAFRGMADFAAERLETGELKRLPFG